MGDEIVKEGKAYCPFAEMAARLGQDPFSVISRRSRCLSICPIERVGSDVTFIVRAPEYRRHGVGFGVVSCDDDLER